MFRKSSLNCAVVILSLLFASPLFAEGVLRNPDPDPKTGESLVGLSEHADICDGESIENSTESNDGFRRTYLKGFRAKAVMSNSCVSPHYGEDSDVLIRQGDGLMVIIALTSPDIRHPDIARFVLRYRKIRFEIEGTEYSKTDKTNCCCRARTRFKSIDLKPYTSYMLKISYRGNKKHKLLPCEFKIPIYILPRDYGM